MKEHILNHVLTKTVFNKSKYISYLRFFKVATLCLDDSFAHSWDFLNKLHLECFSNGLEGVPTCGALAGCFSFTLHPIYPQPSQLGWGQVIVDARSSDAALHHSPSLSNSLYTAWRCVGVLLGHCPVEKQMIVPQSTNQMGWRVTAECCWSHAGYVCLDF